MTDFATTNINSPSTPQSTIGFIPTIWTGALMHNYYEISAVPLITKKAPVIKGNKLIYSLASKVNINKTTTSDPQNAQVIYQQAQPSQLDIEMNQIYNWGLTFNDINLFQTNLPLLQGEMYEASMGLDEEISKDVYTAIFNSAGQTIGNVEISPENAYDYIVDLLKPLNDQKVPKWGRYVVIDYTYLAMLSKDPRYTFQPNVLAKGIVEGHKINGATIIATADLQPITTSAGTVYPIFAIQSEAFGFGMQFDKVQYLDKLEGSWNEAVRGRALVGYGVLRPNSIVSANVTYNTSVEPNIEL